MSDLSTQTTFEVAIPPAEPSKGEREYQHGRERSGAKMALVHLPTGVQNERTPFSRV